VGVLPGDDVAGARDAHGQLVVLAADLAHGQDVEQLGVQRPPVELKDEVANRRSEEVHAHGCPAPPPGPAPRTGREGAANCTPSGEVSNVLRIIGSPGRAHNASSPAADGGGATAGKPERVRKEEGKTRTVFQGGLWPLPHPPTSPLQQVYLEK